MVQCMVKCGNCTNNTPAPLGTCGISVRVALCAHDHRYRVADKDRMCPIKGGSGYKPKKKKEGVGP